MTKTLCALLVGIVTSTVTAQTPTPETLPTIALKQPEPKGTEHTTIDSNALDFDTKASTATFTGDVTVLSPQFRITTDGKFVVQMKKDSKKPALTAVTAAAAVGTGLSQASDTSNIEFADADGRMVTVEKKDKDGKLKKGTARHMHYDGKTGDVTLRDNPQVQDGMHMIIGIEPTTKIILSKDGKLSVFGRARTELIQPAGAKPSGGGGGLSLPVPGKRNQ
jgi:lipopolysaccharide export system protein LptA